MKKKSSIINHMNEVKDYWNNCHKELNSNIVTIGDFSYGMPNIISWDENTKVKIGKFCSLAPGITILAGGEHRSDWGIYLSI